MVLLPASVASSAEHYVVTLPVLRTQVLMRASVAKRSNYPTRVLFSNTYNNNRKKNSCWVLGAVSDRSAHKHLGA